MTPRIVLCAAVMLAMGAPARAATISDSDAAAHAGDTGTVCGIVAWVYASRSGATFLDFGRDYPHESFAAVVLASPHDLRKIVRQRTLTDCTCPVASF